MVMVSFSALKKVTESRHMSKKSMIREQGRQLRTVKVEMGF